MDSACVSLLASATNDDVMHIAVCVCNGVIPFRQINAVTNSSYIRLSVGGLAEFDRSFFFLESSRVSRMELIYGCSLLNAALFDVAAIANAKKSMQLSIVDNDLADLFMKYIQ